MAHTPRLLLVALTVLLVTPPTLAAAQAELDASTREQLQTARSEARAHRDAGRYALAAQSFQQLHELMRAAALPHAPLALFDAGSALSQLQGRETDSLALLRRFLSESSVLVENDELSQQARVEILDRRSRAVTRIAELEARAPQEAEPEDSAPPQQTPGTEGSPSAAGGISPIGPVVLGLGGAVLVAGLIVAAVGLVQNQQLIDRCPSLIDSDCDPALSSEIDSTRALGLAGDVLWIAGAAVALTGLILTLTLDEGAGSESAQIRFEGVPGGASMALRGEFQ